MIREPFRIVPNREALVASLQSPQALVRSQLELHLATLHRDHEQYTIPGICPIDHQPVDFEIDRQWGAQQTTEGVWIPNWRERLECPLCHLNNRQRAMASLVLDEIESRSFTRRDPPAVYMMEQVTYTHHFFATQPEIECIGSEFLGPEHQSGAVVDGVRHEDAGNLSFDDRSIDIMISNEVLEHVPDPAKAIAEASRVLRPDGVLYFTIPFDPARVQTRPRAELIGDQVVHHLPPEHHGNPATGAESLVFTDFGWDFIDAFRATGFAACVVISYWSLEFALLGPNNILFRAQKVAS